MPMTPEEIAQEANLCRADGDVRGFNDWALELEHCGFDEVERRRLLDGLPLEEALAKSPSGAADRLNAVH